MSESGKFSIYDDRIIQHKAEYAVYKGGESITNTVFNAISQNTAQHNYNCPVPSPNIFVDRAIDWTSKCMLTFNVSVDGAAGAAGVTAANAATTPLITIGKDFALCAFPLHAMTQTMTATINDVVVSMNTAELLPQLLRLTDHRKNLIQRTCPSMLDTYANYNDGYGSNNSPLNSYYESVTGSYNTNGAYGRIQFCHPTTGNVLAGNGTYPFGATTVAYTDGVPTCANAAGTLINPALANIPVGIIFTSTEKLVLPPFIFADSKEMSTGLFGINAFQVLMNMASSAGLQRIIRSTTGNFRTVAAGSVAFIGNGFTDSKLNVLFITPNLAVPLPRISSVPWLEMPRYTTAYNSAIALNATGTEIQSNNIVLPCIPDYFMIFVKPQSANYLPTEADWLLPITGINLNFNNFSGLMNNMTQEQLYHASIQNGLDCDFALYDGKAQVAPQGITNNLRALCGAPLLIKPGKDFHLSQGLACGVNGNFNIQFSVKVDNNLKDIPVNSGLLLYLVCINSGFFESQGGSSRIIRAPLNEADVISAPTVGILGKQCMERMVGGGFFDKISSIVNKAADIYKSSKPIVSAAKSMLPDGKIKDAMSAVGYGKHGRGMASRVDG